MKDLPLPGLEAPSNAVACPAQKPAPVPAPARVKSIDRSQMLWRSVDVEQLIEEDHPARAIWELTGQLDLGGFYAPIAAVEGSAGRTPWDPRLLVSLWVYALSRGVSSAREVARRCEYEPGFQWLCGLEPINYHTLSDFRTQHGPALQELFVQVLGVLSAQKIVNLERVMHDGTKIQAQASRDSFHREPTLQAHLEAARQQVRNSCGADPGRAQPRPTRGPPASSSATGTTAPPGAGTIGADSPKQAFGKGKAGSPS